MGKVLVGVLISIGVLVRDNSGPRDLACHSCARRRRGAKTARNWLSRWIWKRRLQQRCVGFMRYRQGFWRSIICSHDRLYLPLGACVCHASGDK